MTHIQGQTTEANDRIDEDPKVELKKAKKNRKKKKMKKLDILSTDELIESKSEIKNLTVQTVQTCARPNTESNKG